MKRCDTNRKSQLNENKISCGGNNRLRRESKLSMKISVVISLNSKKRISSFSVAIKRETAVWTLLQQKKICQLKWFTQPFLTCKKQETRFSAKHSHSLIPLSTCILSYVFGRAGYKTNNCRYCYLCPYGVAHVPCVPVLVSHSAFRSLKKIDQLA